MSASAARRVFVLVPGAGGSPWYWHRVVLELRRRGELAVAVDLPGPDEKAGLPEYAELIVAAIGDCDEAVVVAQSLGGFSAAMACARRPVGLFVLLNAMVPVPGETPGEWWENTGAIRAREQAARAAGYPAEFDLETYFLHDVPADVLADGAADVREEAEIAFAQPCEIEVWPNVSTELLAGEDDRFFPLDFQRRVGRERLGRDVASTPGGHLAALAYPTELVDRLVGVANQSR